MQEYEWKMLLLGLSGFPSIAGVLVITEVAFSARLEKPRFLSMSDCCWNKLAQLKDKHMVLGTATEATTKLAVTHSRRGGKECRAREIK